jgi:RNA polymerase sigma factor (sigma-70 family)
VSDERAGADAPGIGTRPPVVRIPDRFSTIRRMEFARFYRSEVSRLVGFIVKIGANEHEAAEAAQAAFTQAWVAWESIHTNPRAWVRTVAMREFYRQIPRREFPSASVPDRPVLLSADAVVEASERTKAARELLAELPTTQRHVIAWTADGFSVAEIAKETGRSEAAVRKNLQRARDTLKRRLAENQGGAR